MKVFFFICLLLSQRVLSAEYKFAIIPSEGGGTDVQNKFVPLMEHLSKELKHKVTYIPTTDYAAVILSLCNGHVDFAYLGPKSYVEAKNRCPVNIVVKEKNLEGLSGYKGLVIARSDLPIKSISEAKNLTFAFTGPNSTSGHLVPSISFYKHSPPINPQTFFKEIKFSGSHAASILSIKNKTIDLAATNNVDLRNMQNSGKISSNDYKILWESELIPGAVVATGLKPTDPTFSAFKKTLMTLPTTITYKLGNGGFMEGNDQEYDVIRYLSSLKKQLEQK